MLSGLSPLERFEAASRTDANSRRVGFWKSVFVDKAMPRCFLTSKIIVWPISDVSKFLGGIIGKEIHPTSKNLSSKSITSAEMPRIRYAQISPTKFSVSENVDLSYQEWRPLLALLHLGTGGPSYRSCPWDLEGTGIDY